MKVVGLDNSYWIALGVAVTTEKAWSYNSPDFIGSNSVGNIMGPQESSISGAPT